MIKTTPGSDLLHCKLQHDKKILSMPLCEIFDGTCQFGEGDKYVFTFNGKSVQHDGTALGKLLNAALQDCNFGLVECWVIQLATTPPETLTEFFARFGV